MKSLAFPFGEVPYATLVAHPVWEYMPESARRDETWIRPVSHVPVKSLDNRIVVSFVRLANGQEVLGLIGNVELHDPAQNVHFLTLSIVKPSGEHFDLARYQDVDYDRSGPKALSKFLNLSLAEVFPIQYDISAFARGNLASIRGIIPRVPPVRLSQAELIALAVGSDGT